MPGLTTRPGQFIKATSVRPEIPRSVFLVILTSLLAVGLPLTAWAVTAVGGNIHPEVIEIDENANHYPAASFPTGFSNGLVVNSGATVDWVKDSLPNTDSPSLTDSIAVGIIPNVTGATGGKGHWYGVRIVDGIAGNDQNIFLTGGKENDVRTWNIGPGSIGSSKYDATQAYLANNQTYIFFGMERRGNNGTTAFDFEFNKKAPLTEAELIALGFDADDAANLAGLVPNRSVGDVLATFEMHGSGGSGDAEAFLFAWNGSAYVEDSTLLAGVFVEQNESNIPSPPWGNVNSKGNWVLDPIDRFQFAEAAVPLSVLNTSGCGGSAFVQVRTRSSAEPNSDLKDATEIFEFVFGGPTARATLATNCDAQFTFDGTTSTNSTGGTTGLTYAWTFTVDPTTATLGSPAVPVMGMPGVYTATGGSGTVTVSFPSGVAAASISAELTVTESGAGSSCQDSLDSPRTITVYPKLAVTATLTGGCTNVLNFSATVTGGLAPYTYAWSIQKFNDMTMVWDQVATSTAASGTHTAATDGLYRAVVTVTDTGVTNGKPQCTASDESDGVPARLPLNPTATKGQPTTDGTGVNMSATAHAADSVGWQVRDADTNNTTPGAQPGSYTTIKTDPGAVNDAYSLLYASFKTHDTTPSAVQFVLDGVLYKGLKYEVEVRIHATRTLNGITCEADSTPVKISYIEAADPDRGRHIKRVQ